MPRSRDSAALLPGVVSIARDAGAAVDEVYRQTSTEVSYKADESPLTAADLASHRVIAAGLKDLAPEIPILSEEGVERPYDSRRAWDRLWIVDPLDGTKEFIKRNGEFTVNIALVENGVPVLGVVYAPVLDRTYLAAAGDGAWRRDGDAAAKPIRATGTAVEGAASGRPEPGELAVVASRSHPSPRLTAFLDRLGEHRLVNMGSSLKLCLVAEGAADVYPRLGPTMEWDTAAAHAVALAAGGQVLDFTGKPLGYNKQNLLNPHFIVLGERHLPWREAFAASES
ncbi:MAG: 3'(2'),5'-bisphosphate nucleotidase CysQ [bacterium]|nr:3'(2'),5'-bisphosphate nucleotidase CysQ [bacterium]